MVFFRPIEIAELGEHISDKKKHELGRFTGFHTMDDNSFKLEFKKGNMVVTLTPNQFMRMIPKNIIKNRKNSTKTEFKVEKDGIEFGVEIGDEKEIEIEIFNRIKARIYSEFEELETIDNKKVIVLGKVQSGKTFFELSVIWLSKFVHERQPVFLLSNSLNSYSQVENRDVTDFNSWIDEISGFENKKYHLKIAIMEGDCRSEKLEANDFILAIGNPTRMCKVKEYLDHMEVVYDLIVDEADTFIKDIQELQKSTKTGNIYDRMVIGAYNAFEITATPFANLNKKENISVTMRLPQSSNYRGLEEMEFIPIEENLRSKTNIGKLVKLIGECLDAARPNPDGYTSILVNASHTNKMQKEQAIAIKKKYPGQSVYVINTDENRPSIKEIGIYGEYMSTTFANIHDLYAYFTHNQTNNIIVSGFMASRANTYRPLKNVGSGGLAALIFVPTGTQHAAGSIQSMRIFGKYAEEYPKILLYTTQKVYDNINYETQNYENWISEEQDEENTRLSLEGKRSFKISGKHDRKKIDDTKNTNEQKLARVDYATWEEAYEEVQRLFPGQINGHKGLTERHFLTKEVKDMKYYEKNDDVMTKEERSVRIREQNKIKGQMGFSDTNQVAWYPERYEQLNDIEVHYKKESNYCSHHTTGDCVSLTNIPYITWKPKSEDAPPGTDTFDIESCDKDKMYWMYTTKGTVRIYLPFKTTTKYCTIAHKK
jgi:hypothetical protein